MTRNSRNRGASNIYTLLSVIALVALIIGVGYMWYRNSKLTGSLNPFTIQTSDACQVDQTGSA